MQRKRVRTLNKQDVLRLFETGKPGAEPITQFIDGEFVSYWVPSLSGMPVSAGALEKFDSAKEATQRAQELKAEANRATIKTEK